MKEGNDKAPGRFAVELSHRGARLVTESGGERVVPRDVVKPHHELQRGSVQQVRRFLCLLSSWGRQHDPNSCGVSVLHQHKNLRFVKAQGKTGQMNCGTTVMECYVATKKKERKK